MKYIYYYLWVGFSSLHPWVSMLIIPMIRFLLKLGLGKVNDINEWKTYYNKAILGFPGGINDWFAYGLLVALFLIPIIILTVSFGIDIYTNGFYFGCIAFVIGAFCYYWIYFRKIHWLRKRINRISERYFIE